MNIKQIKDRIDSLHLVAGRLSNYNLTVNEGEHDMITQTKLPFTLRTAAIYCIENAEEYSLMTDEGFAELYDALCSDHSAEQYFWEYHKDDLDKILIG